MTAFAILVTDILFVLLLSRVFAREDGSAYMFNPYLVWADKATYPVIRFAGDIMPGAPKGVAAFVSLLFLVAFRGALFASGGAMRVFVGSTIRFVPRAGWLAAIAASAIEFIVFLVRFWGMYAIVRSLATPGGERSRMGAALAAVAHPFSATPAAVGWAALVVLNIGIAALLPTAMAPCIPGTDGVVTTFSSLFDTSTAERAVLARCGLGILSMADMVLFTREAMVIAIFGSLIAAIFRLQALATTFLDFENALMGRFSRRNFTAGMFDFSALIFFMAVSFVYGMVVYAVTMALKHAGILAAGALAIQHYE